jgi:8-oxo-dGTP diphosphatase
MDYNYKYPRPAVTVDIFIYRNSGKGGSEMLLIKRKHEPFKDCWAFPGGFMDMDETLEEAAARELEEETSLTGTGLTQFKTYSKVNRDPRGRTITVMFYGKAPENAEVHANDDAAEAQWFSVFEPPVLAFDHQEIFDEVFEKLFGMPY